LSPRFYNALTFAAGAGALVILALVFAAALNSRPLSPAGDAPTGGAGETPGVSAPTPAILPSPDFTQQPLRPFVEVSFQGPVATLSGYSVHEPGDGALVVTLLWHDIIQSSEASFTVFVQLEDSSAQLLAQSDSALTGDASGGWDLGYYFASQHTLALPADLPPGEYRLWAGLYNSQTGLRILADDPNNGTVDRVMLGPLEWPLPTPTPSPLPFPTPTPCQIGCLDATPTFSLDLSAVPPATPTPCQIGCPDATPTPTPCQAGCPQAALIQVTFLPAEPGPVERALGLIFGAEMEFESNVDRCTR
jgi:hypothetical protein